MAPYWERLEATDSVRGGVCLQDTRFTLFSWLGSAENEKSFAHEKAALAAAHPKLVFRARSGGLGRGCDRVEVRPDEVTQMAKADQGVVLVHISGNTRQ